MPDPDILDSNALLDRYTKMDAAPVTVSSDPLYLLTCHVHDMLETAEAFDDPDHPMLEILEGQLVTPLEAIDEELTAAQAFNSALVFAARSALSTEAA